MEMKDTEHAEELMRLEERMKQTKDRRMYKRSNDSAPPDGNARQRDIANAMSFRENAAKGYPYV